MLTIHIATALGAITAELDDAAAPLTVANFLRYVDSGFFDGGAFWRTVRMDNQPDVAVKIEVVQADVQAARIDALFAPIALERTRDSGLRHVDGSLSMSRFKPDTAQAGFFICIGDQPSLDFGGARNPDGQGFAAFGRVITGMPIVRAIHQSPCSVAGGMREADYAQIEFQRLTPPIAITRITRQLENPVH
jgi:peptidyl-prolyl cis-trans isomerase A (cyclophilin A)